ncbi:MAG: adenylate/guanylate cyclase domain-containing protein [Melioribacteraceae bacterium]|nr:adenylate/guanylate cyclase domain-containing protein [Melioribacteraceae bacterium]MCF8354157.1 adenylate/guanylate cyclase domain-containing protein [Melioribacteraceae bacterium]MCF8396029.1 adenylate/guanylate cyclase domain-containing protein [Melioribacteraceae bacterium]MCF8418080.1 adenylate/guanylate cyclase domain-containing protein [Melioribacteraceae bacterium]
MQSISQISSILFADLVGYSRIESDELKEKIFNKYRQIQDLYLDNENYFFSNTWGDGLLICSYDPIDLAEIALKIRDEIRNTNWRRAGFPDELSIRIGLHIQRITLKVENHKTVEVLGKGIDIASRIEPIVAPNQVYCSQRFYEHLMDEDNLKIKAKLVGKERLAKEYGEMNLYKLSWMHESIVNEENHQSKKSSAFTDLSIPDLPELKKAVEFTPEDKNQFIMDTFLYLSEYFQNALDLLRSKHPQLKTNIELIDENKFACFIENNETIKCKAKVWLKENPAGTPQNPSIAFSHDFESVDRDNTYSQWITVENDSEKMYLNISEMGKFGNRIGFSNKEIDQIAAAKFLWKIFITSLEN